MKITVIGTGYVGLVTGACLADTGNYVTCLDKDADKIAMLLDGKCPIYEPGLLNLLTANRHRMEFTTDSALAIHDSEIIFVAVGTPSNPDGSANLDALKSVAADIAKYLDSHRIVVLKSTVPVGTGDMFSAMINVGILARFGGEPKFHVDVVNVPEFLKEGTAVSDFMSPDRIIIGSENEAAADVLRKLHEPFVRNGNPIIIMRRKAAELTKYAANTYLAMRISYINTIASVCETEDIDIDEVRRGMGADRRIGLQFLYPGIGYGGSCFPKDVRAMSYIARGVKNTELISAIDSVNNHQKKALFNKVVENFGSDLSDLTFAMWGIAFKAKTDDIRESPAVETLKQLLACGASVRVHDPQAMGRLQQEFPSWPYSCHSDAYEALEGASGLLVCTEWNEFRSPDWDRVRRAMVCPLIFDGRNLYNVEMMKNLGFKYHSIGRPVYIPR